jgi:hypothetical protein
MTAWAQALMRPGWSSTQLPNFNSHATPGPLSRLTTAFNSSSVKRVSSAGETQLQRLARFVEASYLNPA